MPDTHRPALQSLAATGMGLLGAGTFVGLGAAGAWVLINPHGPARPFCRRIRALLEGKLSMPQAASSTIEEVRWRWWLRTRITARGAQLPRTQAPAHCTRCGDRMGSVHECRDLAR